MTKQDFQELTRSVVLLDGATGSNLMAAGMPRGVCTEQWILDHPDIFIQLQRSYVEAGSQIVIAPTFGCNRVSLAHHHLEEKLSALVPPLVALSREAAGGKAYVAGDITTTGKMMAPAGELTYDEAFDIYTEQIRCLIDSGVDLLLAETMISIDETLAALDAASQICDLPVLCSMTVEADGSLFSGGNALDAALALEAAGACAVGVNCSVGPDQLTAVIRNICEQVKIPVIAKPNAGMPLITEDGHAVYHMDASSFAHHVKVLVDCGATLVGGCCGTTPAYIKALKEIL